MVAMHQGSALSPLFVIVMEAISREFRDALLWDWGADDLVIKNKKTTSSLSSVV